MSACASTFRFPILKDDRVIKEAYHDRFNVYFYLEDDSIHISEPRTTNSGTPQGTFIRRHVIPSHDNPNAHLTVDDLNVGKQLVIYARCFQLTGCDEFTRQYLTSIGKTVPKDQPQPVGQYEVKRQELADRYSNTLS